MSLNSNNSSTENRLQGTQNYLKGESLCRAHQYAF